MHYAATAQVARAASYDAEEGREMLGGLLGHTGLPSVAQSLSREFGRLRASRQKVRPRRVLKLRASLPALLRSCARGTPE